MSLAWAVKLKGKPVNCPVNMATDVGEWAKWAWRWVTPLPGSSLCTRYPA